MSSIEGRAPLSPVEIAQRMRANQLLLADVREDDERLEIRPAGSLHLPLGDLPRRLDELLGDRTVAFICQSAGGSAVATRGAADRGIAAVDVRGGLSAWAVAELPVESGPAGEIAARTVRR